MAWSSDNILSFASPIPIYIGRAATRRDEAQATNASSLVWQVHIVKPDMPNDTVLLAEKDAAVVSLDWAPAEYGGSTLLIATDRAISLWQRVNGLANHYEKIVLNSIAVNDIILARWARPPSNYTLNAAANSANATSLSRKFYTLRPDGADIPRDPSIKHSFVTVSADGTIRWMTSAERVVASGNLFARGPVFSVAEHTVKSCDGAVTSADVFFISHSKAKFMLTQTSSMGCSSICFYTFVLNSGKRTDRTTSFSLSEGSDPLVSRLDFSTVNLAGYAANPLTISAVDLDISTIDIVSCQFDINDSDIIYVIVKDGSKRSFLQRWEYRPVYMTAPDSFSWLVQLSKQSPSAVTNFKSWKLSVCHVYSDVIPSSITQMQGNQLAIALSDGQLEVRACESFQVISQIAAKPSSLRNGRSDGSEDVDFSAPEPKRRRLNDDTAAPSSVKRRPDPEDPVFLCPSPNSTCLSVLRSSRAVDMYHLAPCVIGNDEKDPLSLGLLIADMYELSIVKGLNSWDISALVAAIQRYPKFSNVYRIILLKLMRDLSAMTPDQQKHYWRPIEVIKATLYRSAPSMDVNYANSQIRLQLAHIVDVSKGLLRGSIQHVINTNPAKIFEDEAIPEGPGEDKDAAFSAMPTEVVRSCMQLLYFITKSQNFCLASLRQSQYESLISPSPNGMIAASPGGSFGTPGMPGLTPTNSHQSAAPSSSNLDFGELTDEGLNAFSIDEVENFYGLEKPDDPNSAVMDTTDALDAQQLPKDSDSPSGQAPNVQTPALNPVSPAPGLTPGGAMPNTSESPGSTSVTSKESPSIVATPATIMSPWPAYLLQPLLSLPIDTFEQYFSLCDDSRHDVGMALLFEPFTLQLQKEALLSFCGWARIQAAIAGSTSSIQLHKQSFRILLRYEQGVLEELQKLASQLEIHRNTIADPSLPTLDPLQVAIPRVIQWAANIDIPSSSLAKYTSRSQRDHAMFTMDLVPPRSRFLELNQYLDVSIDPSLASTMSSQPFLHPTAENSSILSTISALAKRNGPHELIDVVTKGRITTSRDIRVCGGCNRISSVPPQPSPAATTSGSAAPVTKEASSWSQNWLFRCPCCSGVWFYCY